MLLIPCPHCGPRDESEFTYGGPYSPMPPLEGGSTAEDWHRAVHLGSSGTAPLRELWYHDAGCERWVVLRRDPKSHDFTTGSEP